MAHDGAGSQEVICVSSAPESSYFIHWRTWLRPDKSLSDPLPSHTPHVSSLTPHTSQTTPSLLAHPSAGVPMPFFPLAQMPPPSRSSPDSLPTTSSLLTSVPPPFPEPCRTQVTPCSPDHISRIWVVIAGLVSYLTKL